MTDLHDNDSGWRDHDGDGRPKDLGNNEVVEIVTTCGERYVLRAREWGWEDDLFIHKAIGRDEIVRWRRHNAGTGDWTND